MSTAKPFNPIETAKRIEDSYRDYLATTIHFADEGLQRQLERVLASRGYLAKGPFVEAAPPYVKAETPRQLVESGELCQSILSLGGGDPKCFDPDRPLYSHQVRAIRKANSGHNLAVVTGTGSGKTECFLLPMLNDILTEFERDGASDGVRALIMYPMNALANDQLKRLRELLEGTDITFGRYTGDTAERRVDAINRWREENPNAQKLDNEIISREEIRKTPPNILLTNYSMLEYLLLRPEDAPLFGSVFGAKWRHIAIDEAHVYTGALGTEIAFLLRRLKARIAAETGKAPALRCYATSATIGTEEDTPKVAQFAQDLFGEPFSQEGDIDVITSNKDWPEAYLRTPWGRLPMGAWMRLREALTDGDADAAAIAKALADAVPEEERAALNAQTNPLLGLGTVLLGEKSTATLVHETSRSVIDLTSLDAIGRLGIPGLRGDDEGVEALSAMVDVLSLAQRSAGVPILSSRYHSFLRAPEGLYINLWTRKLISQKTIEEDCGLEGAVPVYEVSVCRHCGQAYVLGTPETGKAGLPPWLNSRHEGTDADEGFLPHSYYRLLDDADDLDEGEELEWLCPVCGSRHDSKDGGGHRFSHPTVERIPIAAGKATEDDAKCGHCGYQSRVAIQPMRVSPEAAGSVVCYDLVRDVPPFERKEEDADDLFAGLGEEERRAGSVICFSDRRQDAAFFAPAMERTYGNITRRQAMREAVEALGDAEHGCSPTSVADWLAGTGALKYPGLMERVDRKAQATAWVTDELQAEDSRNSLDGLGVIRIEPTAFIEGMKDPRVQGVIAKQLARPEMSRYPWLGADDYALFATVCLETLRERGAIDANGEVARLRQGADAYTREYLPKRYLGISVTEGGRDGDSGTIQFVGSPKTTENKRSRFIRKYVQRVHGVELTREQAVDILRSLYKFTCDFLGAMKNLRLSVDDVMTGGKDHLKLERDLWTMYPRTPQDRLYVCDTCGCATHLDTKGVCTTSKCDGHMVKTTYAKALGKDRFYKEVYSEEALPLRIEEHTAQLSTKKAREIQADFINGDVNVLSCTTTFELGVDVGDLRTIFMRNVPPTTANYTQRAGRVGRRAGMPGYAITFARLRPHDVAFFGDPAQMITGATRVPYCYLDNDQIACRHAYAVALSEFFRARGNEGMSKKYHGFMALGKADPQGLEDLRTYLAGHPERVLSQLVTVFGGEEGLSERLGISDWSWIEGLLAPGDPVTGEGMGRLLWVHGIKHQDYMRIQDGIDQAMEEGASSRASALMKTRGHLEDETTIGVLADGGVLPKYGFPTDLVELHLPEASADTGDGRLQLQRGMRQAVREYAPGAEIVAGKMLWKSVGIRRPRAQEPIVRSYGMCPECKTFAWPIDNKSDEYECPVCRHSFTLKNRLLVPSYGFEGKRQRRGIGLRRPRSRGYAQVFFSQHWPAEAPSANVGFAGGVVSAKYATNGELCLVNTAGGKGFSVCAYCGAASTGNDSIEHLYYCEKNVADPFIAHYNALGASFTSDVLELSFLVNGLGMEEDEAWESVMWAIVAAASRILEVPETELGGTMYQGDAGRRSVMLYDSVPGGAGHAKQLSGEIERLVETAYDVVANCSCGEETCCYGCIANYYNQGRQAKLSRGAAKRILGLLLGRDGSFYAETVGDGTSASEGAGDVALSAEFTLDLSGEGFSAACRYALRLCEDDGEREFVEQLAKLGDDLDLERPECEVTFSSQAGGEADAVLAWREARIILHGASSLEEFGEAGLPTRPSGWTSFVMGADFPQDVIDALVAHGEE